MVTQKTPSNNAVTTYRHVHAWWGYALDVKNVIRFKRFFLFSKKIIGTNVAQNSISLTMQSGTIIIHKTSVRPSICCDGPASKRCGYQSIAARRTAEVCGAKSLILLKALFLQSSVFKFYSNIIYVVSCLKRYIKRYTFSTIIPI